MYPTPAHPGEARYPPAGDFNSSPMRISVDHAGAMSRYPYPGHYGPRGMMNSPYAGKPPGVSDGMYPQGWSYVPKPGGPYPMQPEMYNYPDPSLAMGSNYAGSNFHGGPPNPYMPGSGRFASYPRMPPGMMQPHAPASPGLPSEGVDSGFTAPPYPGGSSRSNSTLTPNRWSSQDMSQGGSWPPGSYPSGGPATPGQQHPASNSPLSQQPSQQSVQSSTGGFSQQSSFGPMSPQTPFNNQPLTKQSSVSSLRDALLSAPTQSSKPFESQQGSPVTPVMRGTPDGPPAPVLSPGSVTRQDSQLSTSESLSGQKQVNKQLENNVLDELPLPGPGRPDSLAMNNLSPSVGPDHSSPALSTHGKLHVSESKTPVLSPVTRNHSSFLSQYTFSDDQQRKEFLDSLFTFLEREGIAMLKPPQICKAPLDLFRVFTSVQEHGGFLNVLEKRLWRDVIKSSLSSLTTINSSATRALQHYYSKLILPYECHITNTDLALCQSKLENSLSRHTSISSPGSQLSSDGETKEKVVNHHPDASDSETLNDTQQVNGSEGHLSDKEVPSERLGQVVNSNDSSSPLVSNGNATQLSNDRNSKERLEMPQTTENSMDGLEMMEPLPEMSIQDAESVLGMSPSPYPNQQPAGGPGTPSANQSAPSPGPYRSNSFPGPRPGFVDISDSNTPLAPPPSYTPTYPDPSNSPYVPSRPGFPPSYPQQYEADMHHPMGQMPFVHPSFNSGSPYPPNQVPPGMYGPDHNMMHQPSSMGMPPEMPPYAHGMPPPDWPWQPRSRMLSPLPTHIRAQQSMHQRFLQQQQQMRMMQQQQQARASSASHSHSRSGSDPTKAQWQEKKPRIPTPDEKLKALKSSPKPPELSQSKSLKEQSESLKRKLPDWSGCVEGTTPHLMKRRVLYSGDCGQVEPWRVLMSLKSGLLAESTWALDTLNILLHDDRTVGFFYVKHHHGLLNTLVDHFKMTLSEIFELDFNDTPTYQPGYEGRETESEDTKQLFSEANTTDFDIAAKISSTANKEGDVDMIPVSNVFDPDEMKLGKCDDLTHVRVPTVDRDLLFPDKDVDLPIMPESKRKALENEMKLQRIDQTPVSSLLKREHIMSQIPLHRNGRPIRSPRGRERSFLEEVRRRDSIGRPDSETSSTTTGKGAANSSDSRKDSSINHTVRPRSDSVFTSPTKSHGQPSPTLVEEYEIHCKEQNPLWTVSPSRESIQSRCLCISNILRSLSFIPGNDHEFSQHSGVLLVLGRLLLLNHDHLMHSKKKGVSSLRKSSNSEPPSSGDKLVLKHEERYFPPCEDSWWWDCLDGLREDTLVILSNISGQLDLSVYPELISYPIVDGLLHWSVCPASVAVDPLPDTALVSSLSPQRLVLETLAKVSISEMNVDFILATPPLTRVDLLFSKLGQFIGEKRHPVVRQFALVLLSNLAQGNIASSRLIGQQKMIVVLLLQCLEIAEHNACTSGGKLIGGYNPEDPNSLSVAMLRRAATTLHCLSKIPANRTLLLCHRDRILYLCVSQYIEPSVSSILMDVLFELGKL